MDERRYFGLDALRGGMMMLGVVLHAAGFYIVSPPAAMPIPTDRNSSYVFDVLFHFIHSFRMPTFFVLAGFFASLLVEKRGLWGTYRNRAARILAPFLAGLVTILPLTGLLAIDFMLGVRFGTHELIPDVAQINILAKEMIAAGVPVDQHSPAHLWFLYYLLYFYLLIPVCRFLAARSRPFQDGIRAFLARPAALVVLGLYAAATLWPFPGGQVHEGFIFFKPHGPSLLYYGSFFVFGYLFHHYREILAAFSRHTVWSAALALVLFPVSLHLSDLDRAHHGELALHLAAVLANGLCTWAFIYAFVGSALRYFDYESPWTLYISQSSYWVFLVHMPLVCFVAWGLLPYDVPAIFKFLAVATFTTVAGFVTYHYWVQRTWVSAFLNGRRFDLEWPWRNRRP